MLQRIDLVFVDPIYIADLNEATSPDPLTALLLAEDYNDRHGYNDIDTSLELFATANNGE